MTTAVAEGYIKALTTLMSNMPHLLARLSVSPAASRAVIESTLSKTIFERISFDQAVILLERYGQMGSLARTALGQDITP